MEKFKKLKSIPSYLSLQNIDTDMIIPKQFLKTIKRTGLGKSLFYEMRYDENGKIIEDFILNKDNLTIPHPRMHERLFVLIPLKDIDRNIVIPNHGAIKDIINISRRTQS